MILPLSSWCSCFVSNEGRCLTLLVHDYFIIHSFSTMNCVMFIRRKTLFIAYSKNRLMKALKMIRSVDEMMTLALFVTTMALYLRRKMSLVGSISFITYGVSEPAAAILTIGPKCLVSRVISTFSSRAPTLSRTANTGSSWSSLEFRRRSNT